jgi:hypothetical protein
MTTYRVFFDRIGRNRQVEPLTTDAANADALAEQIYAYARPHLRSRDVGITVDLAKGDGLILCGFNTGGTFTVAARFDPGPPSGPMPGYVAGRCGHRVAESEWRAGCRTCERCPDGGDLA